jgi:hypothetical protein
MYRRFIATVTAASIAITTLGAVPAAAGDRETARAVAAILGFAVVGKIIHDNNKKDRVHQQQQRVHKQQPRQVYKQPRYEEKQVHPRPLPKRVSRKLLPGECLRSFNTRHGKVRMFGRKCRASVWTWCVRIAVSAAVMRRAACARMDTAWHTDNVPCVRISQAPASAG